MGMCCEKKMMITRMRGSAIGCVRSQWERAHFCTPTRSKLLNQFRCHDKYITTSPKGVDAQNLVGIDSAVTDLRMREKNTVCVDFFINIYVYLSVCLSVSSSGLQVTVLGRF